MFPVAYTLSGWPTRGLIPSGMATPRPSPGPATYATGTSEDETMRDQVAALRRFRAKHPEKYAAYGAVAAAKRNGTLRPQPCEGCATTVRVHAHHEDYSKPLVVRWLCHACHMRTHCPNPKPTRVGHYGPTLRRTSRVVEAKRLRALGASYSEIAASLGLTNKGSAYKLVNYYG